MPIKPSINIGAVREATKAVADKSHCKPAHVIAANRKRRAFAKEINPLRQEAIHERGFKLDLIFPLSIEQLKGLLSGALKYNEFEELVTA